MLRKTVLALVLAGLLFVATGCRHTKVQNPIANIDSKQPDKVLFDRAMEALKNAKFQVARSLLDTMINTYPDSEYVARAKLSIGDAWYAEGGTAAMQEAEQQYKDFITFFPNLPEAAEAQLKVADIHYKQMEKPDRDYLQTARAEEEYKSLIQQFPDSKLIPQAKQHLRDVQEVLAERQFGIAKFYYLRDNMAASEARLKSLVQSYPLYSSIDEVLYTLGGINERQAQRMQQMQKVPAATREKLTAEFEKDAIDAYSRIVTRYPVMNRADDARRRLAALKATVPTPTPEAIAQNQAEEDSRSESSRVRQLVMTFRKQPDMAKATTIGDPTMDEPVVESAPAIIKHLDETLRGVPVVAKTDAANTKSAPATGGADTEKVGGEVVGAGSGPAPTSNAPIPGTQTNAANPQSANPQAANPQAPPAQVNDVQDPSPSDTQNAAAGNGQSTNNPQDSTSKKKTKKGLRKLIPF
ncbi:MAG TPA: outer membrane protein assembly factor BamD [Candidatus Angelobacter sp.]|nr:outer membrane protein assembly factor BamD [Candidatus Angelobacter sp.]